jgi:hypothetical protein
MPDMPQRQSHWEADIRHLHAAAAGVLRLVLFTASDVAVLTKDALAGDARAAGYLKALDAFLRRIETPQQGEDARLCLTCDRRLESSRRILVALVIPERDDPTHCMALGVCEACVGSRLDRAAVETAVLQALRRLLWPDLRRIAPPASAGQA